LRNLTGISKPFVLKPPLDRRRVYEAGDHLEFSIILFGDARRFERDVIIALLKLQNRGLGVKTGRGRFRVSEITAYNPFNDTESIIYRDGIVYDSQVYIRFEDILARAEEIMGYDDFTIRFLTPYRLLSRKEVIPVLDLETMVKYASRRFTNIIAQYNYIVPRYDIHEVLEKARHVQAYMVEYERVIIKYRGKPEEYYIGQISFEGRLDKKIAVILAFTELAHIGKRASYGHGWLRITPTDQNMQEPPHGKIVEADR
jgi:hypothetical protein